MATTERKVSAGDIIAATVKYTNKDDAGRGYDIAANVGISNGVVVSFDCGEVSRLSGTEPAPGAEASMPAQFRSYSPGSLSIDFNNVASVQAGEILAAVYAFMGEVRNSVEAEPVTTDS